jgi:hypothetical protein
LKDVTSSFVLFLLSGLSFTKSDLKSFSCGSDVLDSCRSVSLEGNDKTGSVRRECGLFRDKARLGKSHNTF